MFATLRALVEVMDALSKDAAPSGVGRLIMDEVLSTFFPTFLAHAGSNYVSVFTCYSFNGLFVLFLISKRIEE